MNDRSRTYAHAQDMCEELGRHTLFPLWEMPADPWDWGDDSAPIPSAPRLFEYNDFDELATGGSSGSLEAPKANIKI